MLILLEALLNLKTVHIHILNQCLFSGLRVEPVEHVGTFAQIS